jgi:hypothetical protein
MRRASLKGRFTIAAVIAALLSSVVPAVGVPVPIQDDNRKIDLINLAHTVEVRVTAGPAGVLIEWRTSDERDSLGFNLCRQQGSVRTQINPSIIAAASLTPGLPMSIESGRQYRWFDPEGDLNARYYLEQIDFSGASTINGPFAPVWSEAILKTTQQAKLLTEVAEQAPPATQTGGPSGSLDPATPLLGPIADQWVIAAQPGLKIGVKTDGWYRVTQPEMVAVGFDVSGNARNLRLFVDGTEVPMVVVVSSSNGALNGNDYIEFYGTGADTPTTDTHVFYLINGSQPGLRMSLSGSLHPDSTPTPTPVEPLKPAAVTATPDASRISSGGWFSGMTDSLIAETVRSKETQQVVEQANQAAVPYLRNNEIVLPPQVQNYPEPPVTNANVVKSVSETPINSAAKPPVAAVPARSSPGTMIRSRSKRSRSRGRRRRVRRAHRPQRNHSLSIASSSTGYLYDVAIKERRVYFSSLLNGSAENFFGGSLVPSPATRTLKVAGLQTDSLGTATLRVGLQGTSSQTHQVNVLLNEVMLGTLNYSLQQFREGTFNVPISLLREGDNVIKFVVTSGSSDFSLFSYAQLTYPRIYRAEGDQLAFALRSSQSATIDGFTTPSLRVLDISNPASVQEVRPIIQSSGGGFSVTVPALGAQAKGSRTLLAQPSDLVLHPASIIFNQPSTLNQPSTSNPQNAADLLIITHKNFLSLPNLATLVAQRQAQGFTVKVVDVEDLFDEFSYGAHTPQAITDFLLRARTNWTKAPKYLLLLGTGTFDPRNYSGGSKPDLVPTKLVDTVFLETGSDDSLADFDNDGIAEIPVGRLPAATVAEANLMLAKIINFSPANVPQSAVMVADTQGTYFFNFEQADNDLIPLLTPNMQANVQKIYRNQQPSDDAARALIKSAINSGAALVNYSGHGNVDVWTGAPIFSASDALALNNGNRLPLVVVMDCLNGYFVAPTIDCLSEALLKAPNGGAVASFSSSGLTIPIGQHAMGQQLFNLLYSGAPMALGDATRQAKAATTDIDVRRTWILFGDPTMKIR